MKKILAAALVLCLLCPIFLFSANAFNENDYIMCFDPVPVPDGVYYVGTMHGNTDKDSAILDVAVGAVSFFFGFSPVGKGALFIVSALLFSDSFLELLSDGNEHELSGAYFQERYLPEDSSEMPYVQEWNRRVFYVETEEYTKPLAVGEETWWVPMILPRYNDPIREVS